MNTALPSDHFPRVIVVGDSLLSIRELRSTDIAADRIEAIGTTPKTYRVVQPALSFPPLPGFDPLTAEEWPTDAEIIAHLSSPPAPVAAPRKQSARVVLSRLTDSEYTALTTSSVVGIQRALETARIEAVISEADPDFEAFVTGCHVLGIIDVNRWPALLAP